MSAATLLSVTDLSVEFATPDGPVHAVRSLDLSLAPGETLGIVGESGSGKTQSMLAVTGLLADNGSATGKVVFDGREVLGLPVRDLNELRGASIGNTATGCSSRFRKTCRRTSCRPTPDSSWPTATVPKSFGWSKRSASTQRGGRR